MRRFLPLITISLLLAGCSSSTPRAASTLAQSPRATVVAATLPVDIGEVRAAFNTSKAAGAPGPQNAVAMYLRSVARGDVKSYFIVTGSRVDTAELTVVREAVFHRAGNFVVIEVYRNEGVDDAMGSIVPAVAETASEDLLQTTVRVTESDGRWFVSKATGTGLSPSLRVRAEVDAEVAQRIEQNQFKDQVAAKPVIYLYPTHVLRARVRLDLEGTMTASAPLYDRVIHGWEVIAAADGRLTDPATGRSWPYLFWEADMRLETGTGGAVIAGTGTRAYLERALELRGLNGRERAEFIEYWAPKMECNPFNLIRFEGADYERSARLTVDPAPDTVIRVFMTFARLGFPVSVLDQPQPASPPARRGFTVVEWGGRELVD